VVLRGLEGRRGVAELLESEGGLREKETVVVVVVVVTVAEGGWCLGEKMVVLVGMDKCEVQKEKGSIVIGYGLFVCRSGHLKHRTSQHSPLTGVIRMIFIIFFIRSEKIYNIIIYGLKL